MPSTFVWIVDGRDFLTATVATPDVPAAISAHLSDSERTRLHRFLKPQRAREFLLGRLLLRYVLTQSLNCSTSEIDVTERPGASPLVTVGGRPANGMALPGFSLSHSRGWLACAVNKTGCVGVDIETPAPQRDLSSLADASFTAQELAWLVAQAHYEPAFYHLWCAKEALYKYRHNAGLHEQQVLPELNGETGIANAFLQHESTPEYHLCLCSATRPERHTNIRLDCSTLLNLSAA